ncbi:MAG TPA: FHA domain-containing protein [Anaerolineales bacterium]|nr:FHA domain-containing protein [Anaerolineales bacterium]
MTSSYGKLILGLPEGGEQEYELNATSVTIGRAMTNDVVLGDGRVSRSHARIECGPQGCTLFDLRSSNGTRLNGNPIETSTLSSGDTITVGNTSLRYQTAAPFEEPAMTMINTMVELEATLENRALAVAINDTETPRLVVYSAEQTWEVPLEKVDNLSIGRIAGNDLVLDHPKVSRQHAQVIRKGAGFLVRDLGSRNGTRIGEKPVSEQFLENGDVLHIGDFQLVFKGGFSEPSLTIADELLALMPERRPVVFVPGLMGSELWLGSERIWPNIKVMLKNPEIFRMDGPHPLEPRGIVNEVIIVPNLVKLEQYNRMGDYLVEDLGYERGKDFFEFAYDWRQDVRQSARLLGAAIEAWELKPPITLIGHSLGTLVSRYYVEKCGGKDKVGRLILMGGPHQGVPKALSSLLIHPEVLPFGLLGERLRRIVSSFPTSYQILPTYACAVDQKGQAINLYEDESWITEEQRSLFGEAKGFRKELGRRSSVPTISIFGYGLKTISIIKLVRGLKQEWRDMTYQLEPNGDSTVPEKSAVLEGSEIHPVQQYHGSLFVDNDVKMRLKLELTNR